jgi:hypothetical protein
MHPKGKYDFHFDITVDFPLGGPRSTIYAAVAAARTPGFISGGIVTMVTREEGGRIR